MKADSKHIPVLDTLRCIAAVSVCLFHFVSTTINFISSEQVKTVFSAGSHGVQVFFVISGFIIPWSLFHSRYVTTDFFRYMLKRVARIYPPYLAAVGAGIVFILLRRYAPSFNGVDPGVNAKQVALHLGFAIPFVNGQHWINPVFWTLTVEMEYYLLIGLSFFCFINRTLAVRALGYLLFLLPAWLLHGSSSQIFPHLPVFLAGILCFENAAGVIKPLEFWLALAAALFSVAFLNGYVVLGATVLPVLLIVFLPGWKDRFTGFTGKISYSLYLLHTLTGTAFVNIMSHYVTTGWVKGVVVAGGLVVALFSAWIFYLLFEKTAIKLSAGIKLKTTR